ncbi:recombinase family protein [Roseococcus sp. YIM B11640]|uniref:recombinase family protein n=1 Tax=Roseococcus sp. YIM B11640 TaxID=3133973 RepID=UPI003C7CD099
MGGKVPLGYDVANRKLVVDELEAVRVRRVFELFVETGSGVETVRRLQAEGIANRAGKLLDKGDVYKALNLRTYIGEVTHKGNVYRGEHEAIVPRDLWDRAHAVLQVSPRTRAAQNRQHAPALLKGLIFGIDGRAMSPTHAVKNGRRYCYYVAQRVLKADTVVDDGIVRRVSAAQIEGAVVSQVRALLHQPEIIVGTWLAARREAPDLTEREVRDALHRLDPLWEELFPAEQARIVRALVERVVVGPAGADIRLRVEGLASLVRDLTAIAPSALAAAA